VEASTRRRYTCARHSHVLPMPPCTWIAVSQTVRAASWQYTLAIRAALIASAGRSSSTAQAAYRRIDSLPSMSARPSASRCAITW
jgi:hypothetical protein